MVAARIAAEDMFCVKYHVMRSGLKNRHIGKNLKLRPVVCAGAILRRFRNVDVAFRDSSVQQTMHILSYQGRNPFRRSARNPDVQTALL